MTELADEENERHAEAMRPYRGFPGARPLPEHERPAPSIPAPLPAIAQAPALDGDGRHHDSMPNRTFLDGRDPDDLVDQWLDEGFTEVDLGGDRIRTLEVRDQKLLVNGVEVDTDGRRYLDSRRLFDRLFAKLQD